MLQNARLDGKLQLPVSTLSKGMHIGECSVTLMVRESNKDLSGAAIAISSPNESGVTG